MSILMFFVGLLIGGTIGFILAAVIAADLRNEDDDAEI